MFIKKDISFHFHNDEGPSDHISLSDISRFHCCAYRFDFVSNHDYEPVPILCSFFDHYCLLVNDISGDSCFIDASFPDEDTVLDFFDSCTRFDDTEALEAFVSEFLSVLPVTFDDDLFKRN